MNQAIFNDSHHCQLPHLLSDPFKYNTYVHENLKKYLKENLKKYLKEKFIKNLVNKIRDCEAKYRE